jgi:hypothetical protein
MPGVGLGVRHDEKPCANREAQACVRKSFHA